MQILVLSLNTKKEDIEIAKSLIRLVFLSVVQASRCCREPPIELWSCAPTMWRFGSYLERHRQGNPLSWLISVLSLDPLHYLLYLDMERGDLHRLRRHDSCLCTCLCGYDAAICVDPSRKDVVCLTRILQDIGDVTVTLLETFRGVRSLPSGAWT
jgi:hypothetical protein